MKRYYYTADTIDRDRRFNFERRRFSYAGFIPERRSGEDRRDAVSLSHHSAASPVRSIKEEWVCCR